MKKDISKYFKPSVIALSPYTSARDEYNGDEGIFLDANENPLIDQYNRYPDPYQRELKEAIGEWRNINAGSIFLGNGSDEIIDLLIKSTCRVGKDRILSLDPSYGMYKVSANINEIPLDLVAVNSDMTVNEDDLFDQLDNAHKLIFICSPNNPNGGIVDQNVIEKVLSKCNGLVVVDEAYIDFSGSKSWVGQLEKYNNLIVLQTFSKSMGAAGIRIGMAFMHKEMIYFLNKIKPPYNISMPNQEVALTRLKNIKKINDSVNIIISERKNLVNELNTLEMVEYIFPSMANFILVRFCESTYIFEQLKSEKIIIRDRSRQKNCEGCLRISIGTPHENRLLIDALKAINSELKIKK